MCETPNATRTMWRPQSRPSRNTAPISWRAAVQFERLEGGVRARNVVIEFPSLQAAVDCYNSPEYQIAAAIRQEVADAEMVVVEGV